MERKHAIAVSGPADTGTDFVAGIPAGESVTREALLPEALRAPRRWPKTLSMKTEEGVPAAISERMRETVEAIEQKFGSSPFWRGFLSELEKEAGVRDWFVGLLRGKRPDTALPATELQKALKTQKALKPRMEAIKPPIPQSRPIHRDVFEAHDPSIAKIEARKKRRGLGGAAAAL